MPIGYPEDGCPFAASVGRLIRQEDIQNMGSLRLPVSGIVYASVCLVLDVIYPLLSDINDLGDMHPLLRAARVVLAMENSQDRWHKLPRTLNAGETFAGHYIQHLDPAAQDAFYGSFKHLMAKLRGASEEELKEFSEYEPASINFRESAFVTATFRRVFLTSRGGFGLGPQCSAPNDVVVVLYGGNTLSY